MEIVRGLPPAVWWFCGGALGLFVAFRLLVWGVRRRREERELQKVRMESGETGERQCFRALSRLWGYKKLLRNLYIPKDRAGSLSEIDLILVNRHGIFVVESKHYQGTVTGEEHDRYWYHEYPEGGGFSFYNPAKQNAGHLLAVRRALEMEAEAPVYSVVAFGDRCRFRGVRMPGLKTAITRPMRLRRTVRRLGCGSRDVFSREDIDYIYERLLPYTAAGKAQKREHLRQVRWRGRH